MDRDKDLCTEVAMACVTPFTLPRLQLTDAREKCVGGNFDRGTAITESPKALVAVPFMPGIIQMRHGRNGQARALILLASYVSPLAGPIVTRRG